MILLVKLFFSLVSSLPHQAFSALTFSSVTLVDTIHVEQLGSSAIFILSP